MIILNLTFAVNDFELIAYRALRNKYKLRRRRMSERKKMTKKLYEVYDVCDFKLEKPSTHLNDESDVMKSKKARVK